MKTLRPADGPKTASGVEENIPKKSAPKIAAMTPAAGSAFEAIAIPAESGSETKRSESDDRKSCLVINVFAVIIPYNL